MISSQRYVYYCALTPNIDTFVSLPSVDRSFCSPSPFVHMVTAALPDPDLEASPEGELSPLHRARVKALRVPWHFSSPHKDYNISEFCLGTGSYGCVYLATRNSDGEKVAIKCLDKMHPEFTEDDAFNEVAVLSTICDHPNIVTLYDVYEDSHHVYLVQELCRGGELFDIVVERKHFTEADAANATKIILDIVFHCHRRGVLHRDIKPENFMLKHPVGDESPFRAEDIRAVDFGLSMFLPPNGASEAVGSVYYTAPEILKGELYGYPADAWSIGVLVFILISGYPPFSGASDVIIYRKILHQELDMDYEPWTTGEVSRFAADFLKKLLVKDPRSRMTIQQALSHPWLIDNQKYGVSRRNPLSRTIINRLRTFMKQNRLSCMLMTLVAHHTSSDAIGKLGQTLHEIDTDDDGLITISQLTSALNSIGMQDFDGLNLCDLVERLDFDHVHAGQVNIDEFLAAALDRKTLITKKGIMTVFKRYDKDGDGALSMVELGSALAECGMGVSQERLKHMCAREGALDGRGVVSSKSFADLLNIDNTDAPHLVPSSISGKTLTTLSQKEPSMFAKPINTSKHMDECSSVVERFASLPLVLTRREQKISGSESDSENQVVKGEVGLEEERGRACKKVTTLDEILRQYSMSGYTTPRRRTSRDGRESPKSPGKLVGAFGSTMRLGSGSCYSPNLASPLSSPSSLASPSMALLGCD